MYNNLCSRVVDDVIRKAGGKPILWVTGHAFIKDRAKKDKIPFAGELSGHFFFFDKFYGHDDAGYASLRLLEYLTSQNKTLSEVVENFPKYVSSPEIKIGCGDGVKFDVIRRMAAKVKKDFSQERISFVDEPSMDSYVRVDFKDGMLILRPSQNGPYMTIKFEAKDQKTYDDRREYIRDILKSYPEIDWTQGVNLEIFK